MTTNTWLKRTEHWYEHGKAGDGPGGTGVYSPGGASLQACVLVLLFAAAVLAERNDCAAHARDLAEDVCGDGTNRAVALYRLCHEIEEDQHALWRTPA